MILRRVINHFRKQEWTAIALDFLIVVVGVFVGLQVSNWNVERQNRDLALGYMERLHDEVVSLIAEGADGLGVNIERDQRTPEVGTMHVPGSSRI